MKNNKKYLLGIKYPNGEIEVHKSDNQQYLLKIEKGFFDGSGSMYASYWESFKFSNLPESIFYRPECFKPGTIEYDLDPSSIERRI